MIMLATGKDELKLDWGNKEEIENINSKMKEYKEGEKIVEFFKLANNLYKGYGEILKEDDEKYDIEYKIKKAKEAGEQVTEEMIKTLQDKEQKLKEKQETYLGPLEKHATEMFAERMKNYNESDKEKLIKYFENSLESDSAKSMFKKIKEELKTNSKDISNENVEQARKISMKALVKNALGKENTRLDEVDKADREEKEIEQLNSKNEINLDEK